MTPVTIIAAAILFACPPLASYFFCRARYWRRAHDRLLVELQPHREAAEYPHLGDGVHAAGVECLECEVRWLKRQRLADLDEATATYEAQRAEIEALRCHDLDAFHDGELPEDRRKAFELHLGTCERCAVRLLGRMEERAVTDTGKR